LSKGNSKSNHLGAQSTFNHRVSLPSSTLYRAHTIVLVRTGLSLILTAGQEPGEPLTPLTNVSIIVIHIYIYIYIHIGLTKAVSTISFPPLLYILHIWSTDADTGFSSTSDCLRGFVFCLGGSAVWPQCWLCAVCAVGHVGCCVGGGGTLGG